MTSKEWVSLRNTGTVELYQSIDIVIADLASSEAREAELVKALEKYGDHLGMCRTQHPEHHPVCDCGYDEMRASLETPNEETNCTCGPDGVSVFCSEHGGPVADAALAPVKEAK